MSDNPNTPEAQAAIAAAVQAFEMGDLDRALMLANDAASAHPTHPIAHNIRGVFLLQLQQVEDALEAFLIASKLRPDYAEAQNNCGVALSDLRRDDLAIDHYRRAIALNADYAEAYNNLGTSLETTGAWEQALERFRKAIALNAGYVDARLNHANLLRDLGRADEAGEAFQTILAQDPRNIAALVGRAMTHAFAHADDPLLRAIEAAAADPAQPLDGRARLLYAAAAAHHQIGDTMRAFALWSEASELRKSVSAYDPDATAAEFASAMQNIPAAPVAANYPARNVAPLFILGMPRSGTTLVEQMLANHPDISAAGELDILELLVRKSGSVARAPSPDDLAAIRDNYLDRLPQFASGKPIVTDKTPGNFLWIGHILAALPEARILHIQRDARAVCWSIFRNDFGQMGRGYPSVLTDLVRYWNDYSDLMDHWTRIAPDRVVSLSYDALVEAPEEVMKGALAQINLPWTPDVLEFTTTKRAVRTVSSQQVRRGLYKGSSEAWRVYEAELTAPFSTLKR